MKRILLVEDHQTTSRVSTRLLLESGYQISAATTCAKALSICESMVIDLAICDAELPDGDGVTLLSHIRRRYGIPGLIVSGRLNVTQQEAALRAGAAAYLVKPISFDHLKVEIANLLEPACVDAAE